MNTVELLAEKMGIVSKSRFDGLRAELAGTQRREADMEQFLDDMMRMRPVMAWSTIDKLANLAEVDSQYLDLIRRLTVNAVGTYGVDTEADRRLAVQEQRLLMSQDPVTERVVHLWTDYGFGLQVQIAAVDPKADVVWQEFWTARRNNPILGQRVIQELSDTLLRDGEFWFVYFTSKIDGKTTVRYIPTDEITEIVADPDDGTVPIYYLREWQDDAKMDANDFTALNVPSASATGKRMYYRDWRVKDDDEILDRVKLKEGVLIASEEDAANEISAMHVAHRLRGVRLKRGWPLQTTGSPWARAYKEFLENRAAVARAVASIVDKLKVKGGSRAVDLMRARFSAGLDRTSPTGVDEPAMAASTWIENESLERERMSQATGAGDARVDGGALLAQAGLPGGIPPHLLGRGEVVRMAVADAMDDPIFRQFQRYQSLWVSVWQDMSDYVLLMFETVNKEVEFQTREAKVDMSPLRNVDIEQVMGVINGLVTMSTNGMVEPKLVTKIGDRLVRLMLYVIGVTDADAILEDDKEGKEGDGDLDNQLDNLEMDSMLAILSAVMENMYKGTVTPELVAEYMYNQVQDVISNGQPV